ncbi:B-cell receptor CD22-like isoform X3 [Ctenopharyngodon idella]|uniref:B-cell receptor CD22-like isoform X3 n=1 Tax=Ctenopharyngodon idella TaxID=7959 RepID=UPI00222FD406|nr:B-cell receptor CD22-like isoform X3 [Ctenopharyngodon idella]
MVVHLCSHCSVSVLKNGVAMVMSVRMAPPLPLIFLIMIHGVSSAHWGVSYSPSHICALKDSSVIMDCTYTYPTGYQIMRVFWTKGPIQQGVELLDLSNDTEYSQRLQYLGDKQHKCTIRLSHVTLKDSHMYYFRFITYDLDGRWTGVPGVTLTVTDLQVESPERVTEGDSVRLTCKSSCTLTDRATFIWYRNSQLVTERRNNELLLQSVRREDAGRYSCAVHGHNHTSPAVQLSVMYPPKSVSVSISPSGEIVSGDSVTLSCSSDSNPPAEINWFKGRTFVGSGRIYSISKISSDDSGKYKCKSINEHGEKYSDNVTLNIMYPPRNVSVLINGSGEIESGDSVTLICSSDSNPPALNFSWFKGGTFVGSGRIYSISKISSDDSGEYKCKSINEHGEKYSDAVTLNVMYPPKSASVSISPSGEIVSGDSVTLNCSSDSNPPALNFSWFKGGTFVGSGRIYKISKISSDDSGEYKCRSINEHGEKYSDAVTLNVMYPPRNVSVLISGSGEIVSGDSVTLICSSDSNPPALNFSWFKENESSAVGSGQSFSALQSGRFYCQAHNQHGSQRSDAVTVTVKDGFVSGHNTFLSAAIVIVAVCAVLFFVCIIMFIRKRKCARVWEVKQKQVQQPSSSDGNHCDDGLYARVSPRTRTDQTAGKTESTDSQKISYATIQYTRDNEDTYENLRMDHPDPAVRSGAAKVIYSRIKGPIQDPSN